MPDTFDLPPPGRLAASADTDLHARLEHLLPCLEWPLHLPWIDAIRQLKADRGAVVMAHSYQSPEIFHGVADVTGDSLALAQAAADCDADVIVLCGVHFMAETAKILAPGRTVLIPDPDAGCSLAASITADDVRALRARFPDVEFIKPCNLCPHMQKITLPKIHACLRDLRHEVVVPPAIAGRARAALERMLAVGRGERA